MTITARFSSVCPNCGSQIQAGERVEWSRGSAARHPSCQPAARPSLVEMAARIQGGADCEHPQFHRSGCVCAKQFPIGTDNDDRAYDAFLASQPAAAPAATRMAIEDAGVYVLADGAIVKVQANREKTRTYAKRWITIGGTRLSEADTREHGEYVYESGLVQQVAAEGRKMSLDEAKAFILRYGVCCRCGRGLKDADSVERGIGPVCVKYFSAGTTGADLIAAPAEAPSQDSTRGFRIIEPLSGQDVTPRSRWSRPDDDELESAAY